MKFHIYKDKKGEWRWSAKNVRNGKIVADSAEGFSSKRGAFNNAKSFRRNAMVSDIVVDETPKKVAAKKSTSNKGK